MKAPLPESFLNKVAGLRSADFFKVTSTQAFSCEYFGTFLFTKDLRATASIVKVFMKEVISKNFQKILFTSKSFT